MNEKSIDEKIEELKPRDDEDPMSWAFRVAVSGDIKKCCHRDENGELDCDGSPTVHFVSNEGYAGLCVEHAGYILRDMRDRAISYESECWRNLFKTEGDIDEQ